METLYVTDDMVARHHQEDLIRPVGVPDDLCRHGDRCGRVAGAGLEDQPGAIDMAQLFKAQFSVRGVRDHQRRVISPPIRNPIQRISKEAMVPDQRQELLRAIRCR